MMKREQKCHIYSHSEKSKQHKRLFAYCLLAFLLLNITLNAAAQDANAIRDLVAPYFTSYTNNEYTSDDKIRVDSVKIIPEEKWFLNLPHVGNIGSASAFAMIEELMYSGRLKKGQKLLLMIPESARFSYCYCMLTVV